MTQMQTAMPADIAKVAGGLSPVAGGCGGECGSEGGENAFSALLTSEMSETVDLEMVLEVVAEQLAAGDGEALQLEGQDLAQDGNLLPLFPGITGLMQESVTPTSKSENGAVPALVVTEQTGRPAVVEQGMAKTTDRVATADRLAATVVDSDGGQATDTRSGKDNSALLMKSVDVALKGESDTVSTEQNFGRLVQSLQGEGVNRPVAARGAEALPRESTAASFKSELETPFGRQGWSEGVANKLTWLINNKQQSAELRLNPPHLGTIEVKINISNDQATLAFTAQHAAVKEALESAMPRLREMLGENGLNLESVDVSDQSQARHQEAATDGQQGDGGLQDETAAAAEGGAENDESGQIIGADGLLDTYA